MNLPEDAFLDDPTGRPAADVLAEIASELNARDSVLIATHAQPDGDALGSGAALALALRALGKSAALVVLEPVANRFRSLIPEAVVEVATEEWQRLAASRFDAAVVLDTSEPERLGLLHSFVFSDRLRRICLDHHLGGAEGLYHRQLIVSQAPAAATLVLSLIDTLRIRVDATMARCLWLALSTDTGWFRFANTTPRALLDAARLVAAGAVPETLHEEIYASHRLDRMRLLGDVLRGLKTTPDGQLVWGYVGRELLESRGVDLAELDGIIDQIREVGAARVAVLITEIGELSYKVSLRAKGPWAVEPLARRHGGGGHAKAAGFRFRGRLEELEVELCRGVSELMQRKEA